MARRTCFSHIFPGSRGANGCKLREGWSKVLDFTRKIGFCLRLAVETEKKTLRKWILLILVLLIPITAVLVALRISQAASREKEMNRLKMEMVSELLNNAEDRRKVATDWFLENIEVNLSLMAVASAIL